MIDEAPATDVALIRRGKWVLVNDYVQIGDGHHMECSECGVWNRDRNKTNYCPHCGASMRDE